MVPNESFTRLKRYNLHEIMHPGVKAEAEQRKKNEANPPEKVQDHEVKEQEDIKEL